MNRKQKRAIAHAIKMGRLKPKNNNYGDRVYGEWDPKLCFRCKGKMELEKSLFQKICTGCREKDPTYTTDEKTLMNKWDSIDDVNKVLQRMKDNDWSWARNYTCKYIDVRIDMRDGGAIIWDNDGNRVGPDALNWQYSKETPIRPNT